MDKRACDVYSSALTSGQFSDCSAEQIAEVEKLCKFCKAFFEIGSVYTVKRSATSEIITY